MNPSKISCHTEYDVMESVVLCKPEFMRIHHVINETQRRYHKENINVETAIAQHTAFMNVLKENGIEVHHLPPKKNFRNRFSQETLVLQSGIPFSSQP